VDLARAFPDLPIVLNHVGGPLGVGPTVGGGSRCSPNGTPR
jgi:predicted TIM-barrel fold metal-dependent hydrolase